MAAEDKSLNAQESAQSQNRPQGSSVSEFVAVYRPKYTRYIGNRPVADNVTEDVDDLMGYID